MSWNKQEFIHFWEMASPVDRSLEIFFRYLQSVHLLISPPRINVNKWRRHSFLHTQRLMLLYCHNINGGNFFWLHDTKTTIHISLETWLHWILFLFYSKGSFLKTSCSLNNAHFWMYFFGGLRLSRLLVLLYQAFHWGTLQWVHCW